MSAHTTAAADLYLAPNRAQATTWNAQQATQSAPPQVKQAPKKEQQAPQQRAGAAHHVAMPLSDFAAKLWEQEGDGRSFASATSIILAAEATIRRSQFKYLQPSRSLSHTLYACMSEGAGVPAFDAACEDVRRRLQLAGGADWASSEISEGPLEALTAAEREAVWAMAQTEELLASRNLVLEGRALALLATSHERIFFEPLRIVLVGDMPLSARWQAFFDACPELELCFEQPPTNEPLGRAEGREVRASLSSGHYAQAQVVLDVIADACARNPQAHFVVTSARALALYERISPPLQQAGLSCSVEGDTQLSHTDFGRAFFAARAAHADGFDWDKAALADALTSVFSGVRKDKAWWWDKRLRGDRLLKFEDVRKDMEHTSAPVAALLDGVPDDALLMKMINRLRAQGFSQAYVYEQLMAAQGLISLAREARDFGLFEASDKRTTPGEETECWHDTYEELNPIWELARVAIRRVSEPTAEANAAADVNAAANVSPSKQTAHAAGTLPRVRIMDIQRASQLAPRSTDVVIACDLTSESYALKEPNSAARALLERLGVASNEEVTARERRRFRNLVELPAHLFVCERPLNNQQADPLYPSAMLEEFMAAYRVPGEKVDETGIPAALAQGLYERGEDNLLEDVQPVFRGHTHHPASHQATRRENVGAFASPLLPHLCGQADASVPRLSPSQIETYLECPYKWFAARRLGADGLDENLGPNRKGSFLHEVFKTFYERFGKKITPQNVDEARALMFGESPAAASGAKETAAGAFALRTPASGAGGIFGEVVSAQYAYDDAGHPHKNRFVVRPGTSEELELVELKKYVYEWLSFEMTFLPTFTPKHFEFAIEGAQYQGCEIKGFIDRIDVDDQGRAVIIDYKGSLGPEHQALSKGAYNPTGKIQALLYASLIQDVYADELGISQVVGALYLSYKSGNKVSGAFDCSAIGKQEIPTLISADSCGLAPGGDISFAGLRAFCDERVRAAIAAIKTAQVAPCPAQSASCDYCPVRGLEKRAE